MTDERTVVRALLSVDGREFTLRVGRWRGTYPVDDLSAWIKLYQGLRDRTSKTFGGQPYKPNYAETVEVLEKLRERIRDATHAAPAPTAHAHR